MERKAGSGRDGTPSEEPAEIGRVVCLVWVTAREGFSRMADASSISHLLSFLYPSRHKSKPMASSRLHCVWH